MEETLHDNEPRMTDGFIWQAPEYFHREKTSDWFWGLGIVAITLIVISILFNNILFAIFLALAAFTLAVFAHKPPRLVTIQINSRGILIENKLYHFSELDSFWIRDGDLHPKILIKSKKTFMPYIVVPLGDDNPEAVRDYLLEFIKEEVHQEPPVQRLMEYLGF